MPKSPIGRFLETQTSRLWHFVKPAVQALGKLVVFRLVPVGVILAAAWYAFIKLIGHVPIGTTPALIMVWSSVLLVLLAFFPRLLDRIKKLKLKDFEIELQDVVRQSTTEDFLSVAELDDDYMFTEKRGWHDLVNILAAAQTHPNRQSS